MKNEGTEMSNSAPPPAHLLADIARHYVGLITLHTRNFDAHDFHDIAVENIHAALVVV